MKNYKIVFTEADSQLAAGPELKDGKELKNEATLNKEPSELNADIENKDVYDNDSHKEAEEVGEEIFENYNFDDFKSLREEFELVYNYISGSKLSESYGIKSEDSVSYVTEFILEAINNGEDETVEALCESINSQLAAGPELKDGKELKNEATKNSEGDIATPDLDNGDIYNSDNHKQLEDVAGIIVEAIGVLEDEESELSYENISKCVNDLLEADERLICKAANYLLDENNEISEDEGITALGYTLSRLSEEIPANRANVTGSFDAKNKTAETQGGNVNYATGGISNQAQNQFNKNTLGNNRTSVYNSDGKKEQLRTYDYSKGRSLRKDLLKNEKNNTKAINHALKQDTISAAKQARHNAAADAYWKEREAAANKTGIKGAFQRLGSRIKGGFKAAKSWLSNSKNVHASVSQARREERANNIRAQHAASVAVNNAQANTYNDAATKAATVGKGWQGALNSKKELKYNTDNKSSGPTKARAGGTSYRGTAHGTNNMEFKEAVETIADLYYLSEAYDAQNYYENLMEEIMRKYYITESDQLAAGPELKAAKELKDEATYERNPKELLPKVNNRDIYTSDEHEQEEDVEGLAITEGYILDLLESNGYEYCDENCDALLEGIMSGDLDVLDESGASIAGAVGRFLHNSNEKLKAAGEKTKEGIKKVGTGIATGAKKAAIVLKGTGKQISDGVKSTGKAFKTELKGEDSRGIVSARRMRKAKINNQVKRELENIKESYSDLDLMYMLDESGYEPTAENLQILKEGLESGYYTID